MKKVKNEAMQFFIKLCPKANKVSLSEKEWTASNAKLGSILMQHLLPPIEFKCKDRRITIRAGHETSKQ
jgi:hypothetical protein